MYTIEDMWRGQDGVLHPREQAKALKVKFGVDAKRFIREIQDNRMIYLDDSRAMYWEIVMKILNEED